MPFPYLPSWPPKDPGSTLDYDFDFTSWLAANETILTAVVTVPTGITLYQAAQISAGLVIFWLSGGEANQGYPITCLITTSAGRTYSVTCTLNCQVKTI